MQCPRQTAGCGDEIWHPGFTGWRRQIGRGAGCMTSTVYGLKRCIIHLSITIHHRIPASSGGGCIHDNFRNKYLSVSKTKPTRGPSEFEKFKMTGGNIGLVSIMENNLPTSLTALTALTTTWQCRTARSCATMCHKASARSTSWR